MTRKEAELLAKLRTRGHWEITIRPRTFVEDRLERLELFDVVNECRVDLRGWDFPHVDDAEPVHRDAEWVGQQTEWEHQKVLWRMYRSGQFFAVIGIPYDWRDESGWWPPREGEDWRSNLYLGVIDTIARFMEVLGFSSQLSQTKAGDDTMVIAASLRKMAGRVLMLDSPRRGPLRRGYSADVEAINVKRILPRAELVASSRPAALSFAEEVFSYFGWKVQKQLLSDMQREVIQGR